jgi:hypothetical protein
MAWKSPTLALNEEAAPGEIIEMMGTRVRIVAPITRQEYLDDQQRRREEDRHAGKPRARAGRYNTVTREFIPTQELPEDMHYFYTVEPA